MMRENKIMTREDIVWLNNKLKFETIGEDFEMDINHWIEKIELISDKWFNRLRALFFNGNLDELESDLIKIGIKQVK